MLSTITLLAIDLAAQPRVYWFMTAIMFAFGLVVGSYLNVVIYRVPLGMSTNEPRRSFCPKCKYQIPVWLNLPVLSWLLLRGRCANCKCHIPVRYPFVELLTGLLILAAWLHFVPPHNPVADFRFIPAFIFISLCVSGSFIDIDHMILPHRITFGGAAAGIVCSALVPYMIVDGPWWENLLHSLGAAAIGWVMVWLIAELGKKAFGKMKHEFPAAVEWTVTQPEGEPEPVMTFGDKKELWGDLFGRESDRLMVHCPTVTLGSESLEKVNLTITHDSVQVLAQDAAPGTEPRTIPLEQIPQIRGTTTFIEQPREAMGMGDANFMVCVGAFLGWKGVLFTVMAGSVIGAVLSLSMIVIGRREWATRVPFGPYLAAGALIFLFKGEQFLTWYLGLGRDTMDGL